MHEGACDLDAAHLPSGESADLFVESIAEVGLGERRLGPLARLGATDAMQRRVIDEVLFDGDVEVERTRLEDDAEFCKRAARRQRHVGAVDLDAALAGGVEARHQRKERRFAGPVEADQHSERGRRDFKGHVVEGFSRAIPMTDIRNFQRRSWGLGAARFCCLMFHCGVHRPSLFPSPGLSEFPVELNMRVP